ncbi:Nephrin like protein [Argiope bruennichi]|uniref:Nephrin like protein n=1 Tax=Argiope bruennichi TaxID=94029 RepID=A0A8T0E7N6_ARGBR|nr:Nephrin like protein [Argiope bruennichi]
MCFDPKIPGYPRYYMDVNEDEGIYNLHIKSVNFQDEGEFQCQVGPAMNHTPIRAAAQLRILIPPDYLTVNGLGQASTMEVKENVTVRLTCQAVGSKPAAQLKWYKNNVEVPKGTTSLSSYGVTGRAKNKVWSRPRYVDPPGPPRIEGYEEGNIVKAGEALTLLCISEGGNPPPQLIWYRSNVQIDSTYYQILGETVTANNLTFIVSAADNTGSYHCKSSNAATKEPLTASIKLSVYYLSNKLWIHGPSEAPRGSTVTLSCETDVSNPKSELSWTVDGEPVETAEENVRETTDGWITTSNITIILNRQEPDMKLFSCYAKNPHVSGTASTTHKLRVVYPPKPPIILGYDAGTPLQVGDMQRFNCVAVGGNPPAMLNWYKGDREISTPVITSGSSVSSELVIRVQLTDNGAFYRCEANNSALKKPLSAFVRLSVRFPPANVTITVQPADPRVGDNVTLTCTSASSNPMSRISWKRNGAFVRDHREETMSSVYGGISTRSRISLLVTSSDDKSQFTCLAKSDEFKTAVTDSLTLRIRHAPVFLQPSHTVEVNERSSTTINMTAEAFPEHIIYAWSRNGVPLDGGDVPRRIVAEGPILTVRNASRADSGAYSCVAENDEGQSKATVTLNVLYGATVESVIIASPSGPVFEGSEATLECKATAHPAKTEMIKWRIKGLPRNGRPTLDSTKSILHISNVSRDFRGPVECWADNGIGGPSVLSVLLNVLYKPMIINNGGELDTDLVRLKCVVDATPNVTVTWTFNGTVLRVRSDKYGVTLTQKGDVQFTSILTVSDIDSADYGIYTCVAKNSLGYDSADIILNDKGVIPDVATPSLSPKDRQNRFHILKSWWIPAAVGAVALFLLCCVLFICCLRKRSNRTTPERSRETRHIDISNLTADEVCNKLLLSGDVKSILFCAEKQHMPLHDYKGHSVFTIEDTYKIDKLRTRPPDIEEKEQDNKSIDGVLKETFLEEIHPPLDKTKDDCPDILRNENCLCLTTSKDSGEPCTSPQSDSPESPRYNSTPSGSTGSCLSVYHEKTSIRSLAGDAESAAAMVKLHPIMVLRIDEDAYKYTES